jgi:hemolysin activation/secretion protein
MSLMSLSAPTARLRRLARAHAAGEVTTNNYLAQRREVIQNYRGNRQVDDTQRRALFVPSQLPQAGTIVASPDAGSAALNQSIEVADDRPTTSRALPTSGWRGWLLLSLIVGLCLIAMQSIAAVAETIGPRNERDPNPQTSPRLQVAQVQMQGSVLDAKVNPVVVQGLIDETLVELRARHALAEHGFSQMELQEVGRFLNALGVGEADAVLAPAAAQDLVALIAEQRARRGISVAELEELAARVQRHYRQQGYFLAVVVLPPQAPNEGVVLLQLLPGVLGDVMARGSETALVQEAFADLLGKPLHQSDMESRFTALKDLSGLKAQMAFQPGSEPGATTLNVDVLEQRRFSALLRIDNHGYDSTGNDRLVAQLGWLNPRGVGDFLQLQLLSSVDPADQQYINLDYQTPVFDGSWQLNLNLGNNRYDLSAGTMDLDGDSRLLEVGLSRTHYQSRKRSVRSFAQLGRHELRWSDLRNQQFWFVNAGLAGHYVWDDAQIYIEGLASAELGTVVNGRFSGQAQTYWRLYSELFAWKPFSLSWMPGQQKIAVRLANQVAASQLPATRELGLGGPDHNRAFDRASYLADQGVQLGLELRSALPVGEALVFLDSSYGEVLNDRQHGWGQLTSFGFGWNADWRDRFTSRLSIAWPLAGDSSMGVDEKGSRIYWTLQYAH